MTDHPAWFNDAAEAMGDLISPWDCDPPDPRELLEAALPHIRAATWDMAWHPCQCGKPIFEDHDELCDRCRPTAATANGNDNG